MRTPSLALNLPWAVAAGAAAAGIVLTSCSDTTANSANLRGGVAVSFATQSAAAAAPAPALAMTDALADTMVTGADTLILTNAQLVLRQIELKASASTSSACDSGGAGEGCQEIEVGPLLADLPLTPGATQAIQVDIPAGTYSRVDFEVHRVESGNSTDAAFLTAHPEFAGKSIRVTGTFNGRDFVFESELDVEQELTLAPALVVPDQGAVNVTIFVDVGTWFRSADGAVLDPATANTGQPNESVITENIKNSLKAFEDDNRDGEGGD